MHPFEPHGEDVGHTARRTQGSPDLLRWRYREWCRDGDAVSLVYQVRGTSGVLSPEVHPWGFHVVPRPAAHVQIEVECHERAGPGPAEVTYIATLTAAD